MKIKSESESKSKSKKRKHYGWHLLIIIFVSLVLGVNLYCWNAKSLVGNALPMPFGYGASVVLSGSMEPVLSVNDLVIIHETKDVSVGDIIVYQSGYSLIIHRIVSMDGDTIITQGDANNTADKPISISDVKGKMSHHIPLIGGAIRGLKTPVGIIITLAVAILLIELSYTDDKKKDNDEIEKIKEEIRRLKEENEEANKPKRYTRKK